MRGQFLLFADMFQTEAVKSVQQRPRNYYQPERNTALLHRYYFHAEINRYRYDDCLKMLEQEFYLTSPRIIAILTENMKQLELVITSKPSVLKLKKQFPHFNWSAR